MKSSFYVSTEIGQDFMRKSFYVDTKHVKKLQDLVKANDLRFDFFTPGVGGSHYIQVSGPVESMNEFSASWNQLTTNIKEVYRKPSLKVRLRKIIRSIGWRLAG